MEACGPGCKWRRFDFTRVWVGLEKGVVIGGRPVVPGSSVLGGGRASTRLGWNGAAVVAVAVVAVVVVVMVAAAAVELGVVAGRLGLGRSAGSVMVSGGGKGRKQGMDE